MIIDLNSLVSSAGVFGTLEALTGRRAIERQIRDAVREGKKTAVKELAGGNLKVIKSKVIRKALQKHDPVIQHIMNDVCKVLGKACVSFRHIFNPDMIILGGGLIEACGDYILPRVRNICDKDKFLAGIDKCSIVQSSLGDDAVIYGAVALVKGVK
jgi:glucokinase